MVALSLAVFDHTHSALAVAALLFAWQALPAFLVPGAGRARRGVRAPQRAERPVFFEAVATAALAVLLWHFSLPAVLVACSARRHRRAGRERAAARGGGAGRARSGARAPASADESGRSLETQAQEAERKANAALNVGFSVYVRRSDPRSAALVVAAAGRAGRAVHRRRLVPDLRRRCCSTCIPTSRRRARTPSARACARRGRTSTRSRRCAGCCCARRSALIFISRRADRGRLREGDAARRRPRLRAARDVPGERARCSASIVFARSVRRRWD